MAAPVFVTDDVPSATQVNQWMVNNNFVYKTALETVTSSVTLQDDNHLTLPLDAGYTYAVNIVLKYDGATAGDIKWAMIVPAGAAFNGSASGLTTTAAATTDDQQYPATDGVSYGHGALGVGTPATIFVQGIVTVGGTAGNMRIQWAQGTSSGTATTMYANSYMWAQRVA